MSNDTENVDVNEQYSDGSGDGSGSGGGGGGAHVNEDGLVVSAEKKPVSRSTLVLFAVLMIGAAGVYVMYRQAGPKVAGAAVARENAEAKKTINSFLSGGETSVHSMLEVLKNTEKIVQQF